MIPASQNAPYSNIRVALYARFSSDNQRSESIDAQVRAMRTYCQQHNYSIVHTYVDEAKSATTDRRLAFQQMIADSGKHSFDILLVHKLDRFARDRYDSAVYKRELKKNGVTVYSVLENLDNTPESIMLEAVLEGMSEYYSQNLAREVMLSQNGYRTKIGKPFTKQSFKDLLRQEKYVGNFFWNKSSPKFLNPRSKTGKSRNSHNQKPLQDQIRIHDESIRIISDEVFEEAQKLLANCANGKAANKARHHYTFGSMNLIKCGHCGAYMVGRTTVSHGRTYKEYCCPNHTGAPDSCPTKAIRTNILNSAVLHAVLKRLLTNASLEEINEALAIHTVDKSLTYHLSDLERKIENLTANPENTYSEALSDRLLCLEKDKTEVESQIAAAKEAAFLQLDAKNLKQMRKDLRSYLTKADDLEVRQFLLTVVREIIVDNQDITFTLNIA